MFANKCKKCGGKVISANTNIEIETNGVLKTVTNVPGKKCSKCGHIIVDNITMEKVKQYEGKVDDKVDCGKDTDGNEVFSFQFFVRTYFRH